MGLLQTYLRFNLVRYLDPLQNEINFFQIEMAKSTPEYERYLSEVLLEERRSTDEHPRTPDRTRKYRFVLKLNNGQIYFNTVGN